MNYFTHEGKQVIFVAGNPKDKENIAINEINSAGNFKNLESVTSKTSNSSYVYHKNINGCWHECKSEVRVNQNKEVEVSLGHNQYGQQVWSKITRNHNSAFTVLKVDKESGKITTEDGRTVANFSRMSGGSIDANTIFKQLDKSKDGAYGLKANQLNDLLINGKRPIFLDN